MIGAIIGDIAGSIYEFDEQWQAHPERRRRHVPLFESGTSFTDDSLMTLAIAAAVLDRDGDWGEGGKGLEAAAVHWMRAIAERFPCPMGGYGGGFMKWLSSPSPKPYGSCGNGAAMRVSPCGFAASSLDEARAMARAVTRCTHNSEEGLRGAEATAAAIYLARSGASKDEIRRYVRESFFVPHPGGVMPTAANINMAGRLEDYPNHYGLDFTLGEIQPVYGWGALCQDTVPPALVAALEARDFTDAIQGVLWLGGDCDTTGAICGGLAEALYGVPAELRTKAEALLNTDLLAILRDFEARYPGTAPQARNGH